LLTAASDSDRRWLRSIGLSTVIDLRSDDEVQLTGTYSDTLVTRHHLPLGRALAGFGSVRWDVPAAVADHYFELLLDGNESICEALAVLTDPHAYPAVIHCAVGKDRTGLLVALVLSLLGVSEDEVVTDYALSGIGAARLAFRLRDQIGDRGEEFHGALPALLSADPETMRHFLGKVRAEWGSVAGYVDHLGMGSAVRYLRAALLTAG
jgi:hypothetical protein